MGYNIKKVTRVFVNIANGTMWNKITNKELPESPLNPQIYKTYGYPWFKLYDDNMNDVDASDELLNQSKKLKMIQINHGIVHFVHLRMWQKMKYVVCAIKGRNQIPIRKMVKIRRKNKILMMLKMVIGKD